MRRLWSTIIWDVQLQFRSGFYYAGLFVTVIWIGILSQIPMVSLSWILPALLFINLIMTTFYFMAGLVLLEKSQSTLEGLILTPLRQGEYLTAKVATLTFLAGLECLVITVVVYGFRVQWAWLMLGLISLAVIYTLLGFVAVSRYQAINEYIMPSALFVTILILPLIPYFELWPSPIFYVLPTQPGLILIQAAFQPVGLGNVSSLGQELAAWQMVYAVLGSLFWMGLGYWWSNKVFCRFIINH